MGLRSFGRVFCSPLRGTGVIYLIYDHKAQTRHYYFGFTHWFRHCRLPVRLPLFRLYHSLQYHPWLRPVLNSRFSLIFGLPVSVWGLVYFTGLIFSALMANHYRAWQTFLTVLLSFGALGALFFLGDQFFVIKKVCEYCFTTDTLIILLFLWNLNIGHKQQIV